MKGHKQNKSGRSYYGPEYQATLRWIRRVFPVKRGYRINVVDKLHDALAEMRDGGKKAPYRILISKGLTSEQWIDSLLHEISHVIDTDRNGQPAEETEQENHRDSWGRIYAEVYRAYWDWLESRRVNNEGTR